MKPYFHHFAACYKKEKVFQNKQYAAYSGCNCQHIIDCVHVHFFYHQLLVSGLICSCCFSPVIPAKFMFVIVVLCLLCIPPRACVIRLFAIIHAWSKSRITWPLFAFRSFTFINILASVTLMKLSMRPPRSCLSVRLPFIMCLPSMPYRFRITVSGMSPSSISWPVFESFIFRNGSSLAKNFSSSRFCVGSSPAAGCCVPGSSGMLYVPSGFIFLFLFFL